MDMFHDYRTMLEEALAAYGVKGIAARLGVHHKNVALWLKGQFPRAEVLFGLAKLAGWRLVKTGVNADNHLEASDFVKTGDGTFAKKIDLRDYEIIPLVKHPDMLSTDNYVIPDNCILRYDFIHKSTPTLAECSSHLVAVKVEEIAIGTLLEQQDVVIIDRGDREVENGRIYLVRTPEKKTEDGELVPPKTFLRRVIRDGDRFTFYSSTHNLPPIICHLRDYGGDMNNAILGRAVRIRGDLRNL